MPHTQVCVAAECESCRLQAFCGYFYTVQQLLLQEKKKREFCRPLKREFVHCWLPLYAELWTPPPSIWPLSPCPSWWKHKQMLSRKRSEASSINTPRTQTVGEREEEDWGRARGKCRGWTGGKEETNKKRDGVCLLWSLISLFLHASNTCPVEGALPRRREAAGRGRAGVLHEKQPMCRRMLAGYWWGVPAHFCWDKRAVLLLFFDKKKTDTTVPTVITFTELTPGHKRSERSERRSEVFESAGCKSSTRNTWWISLRGND